MSHPRLSAAALTVILLVTASPPVKAGDALCSTLKQVLASANHGFRGVRLGKHGGRVKVALPGMHKCRIYEGDWDMYPDVYIYATSSVEKAAPMWPLKRQFTRAWLQHAFPAGRSNGIQPRLQTAWRCTTLQIANLMCCSI